MWPRKNKIDKRRLREIARNQLLSWSEQVPEPDRPLVGMGSGGALTARDIRRHLEANTLEGREIVEQYTEMALEGAFERTMQELLSERVSGQ